MSEPSRPPPPTGPADPAEAALAHNLAALRASDLPPAPAALGERIQRLHDELRAQAPEPAGLLRSAPWYNPTSPGAGGSPPTGGEGAAMAKLQACPKCGAQFDVTPFARGQQFRCGACGHLITAHEAAPAAASAAPTTGRVPGTRPGPASAPPPPGPTGRVPGGTAPSTAAAPKSPRGPQYQPVQRTVEAPPRGPARAAPEERPGRERRGRAEPSAKKGPPLALIGGGAALLVVVVLIVVLSGGKGGGGTTSGGAPGAGGTGAGGAAAAKPPEPETPKDTLPALRAEWKRSPPEKEAQWKSLIGRLKTLGGEAKATLQEVYEQYVETPYGSEDVEARKALGFTKFDFEVPEAITQMKGYDFIAAVEEARRKRWLEDDELPLALRAKEQTERHAKLLMEDRVYRAGDNIWANILKEPLLKNYNFSTRWVAPHMICYSSKDKLSELDLLAIKSKKERKEKVDEMRKKREHLEPLLDEKAEIYSQLYKEWNRRFQEQLGLKDLAAEYGGRPDYPQGVRSFQDGVPLVVWIFDTHDAFKDYNKSKGWEIPDGVRGYFQWSDQWIYLFDEGNQGDERVFEIGKNLHEGTHQLESWFTRQLNKWKVPQFTQTWFGEGMAEYFGSHKMTADGKIEFIGVNVSRLQGAQNLANELKKQGKEYPFATISDMMEWTSYAEAATYAQKKGLNPGWGQELYIYQQGWMIFYMCMDGLEGKYRDKMLAYVKSVLQREEGKAPFARCFKLRDEEDWEALQKDFETFGKQMLALDLAKYKYTPPKRASGSK